MSEYFKEGQWVVRVYGEPNETDSAEIGELRQVDEEDRGFPFVANSDRYGVRGVIRTDQYRPATPEEIASHLGEEREDTEEVTPTNTILDRAKSIITGNRQTTNGKPERSFHKIAERWSLTLGTTVTAQQVALMMVDLKMVRTLEGVTTEGHDDHFVDMAGYVALAAELGE